LDEFHQLLYSNSTTFFCVTETWLQSGISSGLIDPNSVYSILSKDRAAARHDD